MKKLLICSIGSIGRKYIRTITEFYKDIEIGVYRTGLGLNYKELSLAKKIFSNIQESIKWLPDYAIICSPANLHLSQAIILAEQNIPLLIEKPLCTSSFCEKEIKELKYLAQKNTILIGYVLRHEKGFSFIKELLRKKEIGNLVRAYSEYGSWLPDWRSVSNYKESVSSNNKLGGGVLMELSHEIDLMNGFFGPSKLIGSSFSSSNTFNIDVEDNASILLKTKDNLNLVIQIDFCTKPPTRNLIIKGTEGLIKWDLIKKEINLSTIKNSKVEINKFNVETNSFKNQLDHFFKCSKDKSNPLVTFEDGFRVIELIKEIKE